MEEKISALDERTKEKIVDFFRDKSKSWLEFEEKKRTIITRIDNRSFFSTKKMSDLEKTQIVKCVNKMWSLRIKLADCKSIQDIQSIISQNNLFRLECTVESFKMLMVETNNFISNLLGIYNEQPVIIHSPIVLSGDDGYNTDPYSP